jgi:molecular chaperone GrpE
MSEPTIPAPPPPNEPVIKIQDKRRVQISDDAVVTLTSPEQPAGPAAAESTTAPSAAATPPRPQPELSPDALELQRLTRELDAARKRVDEFARAIQAGERDREAFKARLTREREQMMDVERGNAALALLEAIDELDLCLARADESPLAKGVRLIRENLLKKAEATGLEREDLTGKPYDPNLAEATDMEITDREADEGRVVTTIRGCYRMKGRVIRPGSVRVAKYVKPVQA